MKERERSAPRPGLASASTAAAAAVLLLLLARGAALAQSGSGAATAAQADRRSPWVELTRRDLTAMRTALLENHPGPVDPRNPGYREWLDHGYERALAKADSVRGLDGMMAVLSFYTSGFEDGHLGWNPNFQRPFSLWHG